MKSASIFAAILAGATLFAAPALAKTSVSKSTRICEDIAKAAEPAPKSVRSDTDKLRSNDNSVFVTLKVRNADDTSAKFICTVDRETAQATLTPSS